MLSIRERKGGIEMPTYTTEYVKNLTTGEPFTFEVSGETLERFERQKELIRTGKSYMLGSIESLTKSYEFSFFPAFEEVLKIWFDNGFTTELITQILEGFGVTEPFIQKLLEDDKFISQTKPMFEGITCDGGRAATTLNIVYDVIKSHYSATGGSGWEWLTNSA